MKHLPLLKYFLFIAVCCCAMEPINAVFDPRDTRDIIIDINATQTACFATLEQDFAGTFTIIAAINELLNAATCSAVGIGQAQVGTTGFTITSSGVYKLTENILFNPSGSAVAITINADNVLLDLQCFALQQGNATLNVDGISVSSNHTNVIIHNGRIQNMTRSGIRVASGCSNLAYADITIQNCLQGVTCLGTLVAPIKNQRFVGLDLLANSTGASFTFANRASLLECTCIGNTQAGIELINSFANSIDSCSIEKTNAATGSAFGISMINGGNNEIKNCSINGVSTNDTSLGNSAVGILIGATENDDVIINNQISNITTTSNAQPFGIEMLYTVAGLTNAGSIPLNILLTANWSPNSFYFATINLAYRLVIYQYSPNLKTLTQFAFPTGTKSSLSWSPDGQFFCVGSTAGVLSVYQFDGAGVSLYASLTLAGDLTTPGLLKWSSDGRYIVAASSTNVYVVNVSLPAPSGILSLVTTLNLSGVVGVDWYQSNYLAVTTTSLTVYSFKNKILTSVASLASCTGNSAWSPDGRYIVTNIGLNSTIVSFGGATLTPVASASDGAMAWAWSPDGYYLVSNLSFAINLYRFSGTSLTVAGSVAPVGGTVYLPYWIPTGGSIASVTNNAAFTISFYSTFQFPSNSLIKNNKITKR